MVANAGICVPKPWDQVTPQIFADTISTNVTGTWNNIRVNSVHPTGVNTPMGSGGMQAEITAAIAGDQRLGVMFMNMTPVDITQPEDVAGTVLFLASDESKFMTAHELAPDAGVTEF